MPTYVGICYFLYGGESAGRPTEVHGESLAKKITMGKMIWLSSLLANSLPLTM